MVNGTLIPAAQVEPNREQRRLLKKKDLAKTIGCSTRQIELMVKAGKLPKPFYISESSPRWRQSDIDAWLEHLATEAQVTEGGGK